MKRSLLVLMALMIVAAAGARADVLWNPRVMLNVTQCELANGSIVNVASNAQVGPGIGVEQLNATTLRLYFASDDIPTVLSPGQYDLYYVDFDIPTRTCGIAHSIDLISAVPLNTSAHDEQPRVSPDGQYLFYAQLGPGGEHDHQIWIAKKNASGLWSNPRKLPSLVNSGHDEHSGSFRSGKLYFSANNRDGSNCGFDMWVCDYDPITNTASNLEKIVFGNCMVAPSPDTLTIHDALIDDTSADFQWYDKSVSWNTVNDGYITGITSSWYEAIISGTAFTAAEDPSVTFRFYRGTSSNHIGGFTDTPPSVSNYHYSNIDIGIYIHSTGTIRPSWDVNNSSYWSTTLPVGYYDVRVQLDADAGTAAFAIEQVANWDSPPSDFESPYWSSTVSRTIGGPYYIQINPYNTLSYVYDVWSGPASPAPPASFVWEEGDPWITSDGSRLYFQMYGAPGTSGHDIFYSDRIECEGGGFMWGNPVLLDANVNGTANDTNPTVTEDLAFLFFSSNSTPAPTTKIMYCSKWLPVASISGTVMDGTAGGPASGVTVALYRDESGERVLVDDAITATDGTYSFVDLNPDAYIVEAEAPLGYAADPTNREVALAGSDVFGIDFTLNALVASISGTVTNITTNAPAPGVAITLYRVVNEENVLVDNATTDAAGSYGFADVISGAYVVEMTVPLGYAVDTVARGVVLVGNDVSGVDFSFYALIAAVSGTVTDVTNGIPASGVVMNLYHKENGALTLIGDTATSPDGTYAFANLNTGTYVVEVVAPLGFAADTSSKEVMLVGNDVSGIDFNLSSLVASISGTVMDVTSGVPAYGVTMALYREVNGEQILIADTTTVADGTYGFAHLITGTYVVEVVVPLGFATDVASRDVILVGADITGIDFSLYALVATNDSRGLGYWKHQVNVVLTGKGHLQEIESDIETAFPQAIFNRFYSSEVCPIQVEGVTYKLINGVASALSVEEMQKTLSAGKGITSLDKAKMHYLTLLLNVVSNKVGQQVKISTDYATVSHAIVHVQDLIILGTEVALAEAKLIAESINEQIVVNAGLIPCSTPMIYFAEKQPVSVVLNQNWPNPFNPTTTIGFTLASAGNHELVIYDIKGAVVKVLSRGQLSAGTHMVKWDGTNARGEKVASGVYFYRLRAGSMETTHKMILMR